VAGFFIIVCGALLVILPAIEWTKQRTEAKTFSTSSLKTNGVPQQNDLIREEDGDLKAANLLSACSGEENPV
jgi:hypothetical protein